MYLILIGIAAAVILNIAGNLRRDTRRQLAGHKRRTSLSDMYPEPPPINYSAFYKKPDEVGGEEFCENLLKTIAWTEKIIEGIPDLSGIDYSRILRSVNPLYKGRFFYSYATELPYEHVDTLDIGFNYADILNEVMALRNMPDNLDEPEHKGKILVFEIDLTTHDGAPAFESEGFVDNSDIPPVDTWFFITTNHLYCWIPTLFIGKMQSAIDVEILESYRWLELWKPELNKSILDRLESQ